MLRRATRAVLVTLAALGLMAQTACVSTSVPADAPAEVRYFAALQDYNTAKFAALRFVQTPTVMAEEGEAVLALVEEGDAAVAQIEAMRADGLPSDDSYLFTASLLRRVSAELARRAAEDQ